MTFKNFAIFAALTLAAGTALRADNIVTYDILGEGNYSVSGLGLSQSGAGEIQGAITIDETTGTPGSFSLLASGLGPLATILVSAAPPAPGITLTNPAFGEIDATGTALGAENLFAIVDSFLGFTPDLTQNFAGTYSGGGSVTYSGLSLSTNGTLYVSIAPEPAYSGMVAALLAGGLFYGLKRRRSASVRA